MQRFRGSDRIESELSEPFKLLDLTAQPIVTRQRVNQWVNDLLDSG
ncbi:MAG: hypothetical protein HC895_03710 [Leptolyngbyaceae cyanobacterium SM1_3_5]|nr:hypothetical protein [Leptolyngbyaceae cyanobacterium SM1_3_5]